jgi:hypothetical protein
MIIPTGKSDTRMTTAKRQTLADFMYYSLCSGQSQAGPFGYSPLPLNLVKAGFEQLAQLKKADPAVDLTDRDVTKCNNPTFVAGNLGQNHLAQIAPMPAACDKVGQGPCGTETGNNQPSTDDGTGAPGAGATSGAQGQGGGAGSGAPGAVDPATGSVTSGTDPALAAGDIYANPTELAAARATDARTFGWLAVAELLGLIVLPGLYVAHLRRRRAHPGGPR